MKTVMQGTTVKVSETNLGVGTHLQGAHSDFKRERGKTRTRSKFPLPNETKLDALHEQCWKNIIHEFHPRLKSTLVYTEIFSRFKINVPAPVNMRPSQKL